VQSLLQIDAENAVKLTIAQYLTPLKRKIQAVGITPDIRIGEVDIKAMQSDNKPNKVLREKDLDKHLKGINEVEEAEVSTEKTESENQNTSDHDYQLLQTINYLKTMEILKK
jgi:carboxyl-terminal processing protease